MCAETLFLVGYLSYIHQQRHRLLSVMFKHNGTNNNSQQTPGHCSCDHVLLVPLPVSAAASRQRGSECNHVAWRRKQPTGDITFRVASG